MSNKYSIFQKIVISLSAITIAMSILYYFVYKPIEKKRVIQQCDASIDWNFRASNSIQETREKEYEKCLREHGV